MTLSKITHDSVIKAINEFDSIGKNAFLSKYGFHDARKYFLFFHGKYYPSKAIIGVAYKYCSLENKPLSSSDFHGGKNTVEKKLHALGFEVIRKNV